MAKFCVSTDSGCDLPGEYCEKRNIYFYRMKYTVGGVEYADRMHLGDCRAFYDKMRGGAVPRTSQMTPVEFENFWSELYQKYGLPILHIALGSGISGTYDNAMIAKTLFLGKYPDAKLFVIDSTLASIGYGMLCIWAADLRDGGKSPEECEKALNEGKVYINTYYTTDDLKYLYRSGRVSRTGEMIATALNINPILNLDREGHLIVREKIRGRNHALGRIGDILGQLVTSPERQTVYICHSDCKKEEVQFFSQEMISRFGFRNSFVSYIGPTIGSHCGPGLLAAFFVGQARD
ncbi:MULTISPECIES: DegV family protein [Acutalibacteraceae]|uniref:DegV family protein n=1 Tax=Acutalibacteraceae TaxID=3082771 RepID=UPI001FAA03CE|nr:MULTISPECIES: DegV family protein [Acutalibacteraceae]